MAELHPSPAPADPAGNDAPGALAQSLGRFIHRHRDATTRPVGHVTYQIVRNLAAAVPYGLATAATWTGFEKLAARTAGAEAGSMRAGVNALARSPVRDIAMIAAGFTLYRGTLRFVRYTKERLFNPEHSEQQSIEEVQHFGRHALDTIQEIAPAEINSTPYGAIALGLGRRYLDGIDLMKSRPAADKILGTTLANPGAAQQRMLHFMKDGNFRPHLVGSAAGTAAERTPWREFWHKVGGKGSRPWSEAGVFILSFLSFFELSDRLFKDVQVRRGIWHGEPNTLARTQPDVAKAALETEKARGLDRDVDYQHSKKAVHPETFGTSDPNLLRMAFTRIAPTVLGIGAYTFTKRSAYTAMGHFTGKNSFLKRATVEGLATATFFVMTTSTDTFEGLWRKWFQPQPNVTLTPEQQRNHTQLLERINVKDAAQGRVA